MIEENLARELQRRKFEEEYYNNIIELEKKNTKKSQMNLKK